MKHRKPRKDGAYIVNVAFTTKEVHLLDYADKQGSFTSYVKRLIAEDMEKKNMYSALESLLNNTELVKALVGKQQQEAVVELEEPEYDENAINDFLDI